MTKKKHNFNYLRELVHHSLETPTFGMEDVPEKPTIKQFCDELRDEMEYQWKCDVRNGIAE